MLNKFKEHSLDSLTKFIQKMLLFQYVQYPIIFMGLGYFVLKKFSNHEMVLVLKDVGKELNEELLSYIGVFPDEVGVYVVFCILAYGYGTLSLILQARTFKSLLTPVLFILKLMTVFTFLIPVVYAFIIETAILIIVGVFLIIPTSIKMIRTFVSTITKRKSLSNEHISSVNDFKEPIDKKPSTTPK